MGKGDDFRQKLITWYEKMVDTGVALPEDEKRALLEWDRKHVDGSGKFATSDWPGWEKYIGKRPE